jgi:hypothetical protein
MIMSFTLYFIMALTGAVAGFLGTDEAAKYIEPELLFWCRGLNGLVLTVSTVMKGYTSETYAKWRDKNKQQPTEANEGHKE